MHTITSATNTTMATISTITVMTSTSNKAKGMKVCWEILKTKVLCV